MHLLLSLCTCLLLATRLVGQAVGIGTTTTHASAVLDINSTTRGVLIPRMTMAQRDAIPAPAKGLLVYDTNEGLYQYNGSAWVQVGNTSNSGIFLPFSTTSASSGTLFSVANTGNGSSILGRAMAASSIGVQGNAVMNGSYGLVGINTGALGNGVTGIAIDNTAIDAAAVGAGVALRGNSPNGYALVVDGPFRFGGNSMGASPGRVLTSIDASGNARWERSDLELVGFRIEDPTFDYNDFSSGITHKIHFWNEAYDLGSDAQATPVSTTLTPAMSVFVVPVTGVYAFNFNLTLGFAAAQDKYWDYVGAQIILDRAGSISALHTAEQYFNPTQNRGFNLRGGCQKRLQAGDRIYMTLRQTNNLGAEVRLTSLDGENWFAGYLVRAE